MPSQQYLTIDWNDEYATPHTGFDTILTPAWASGEGSQVSLVISQLNQAVSTYEGQYEPAQSLLTAGLHIDGSPTGAGEIDGLDVLSGVCSATSFPYFTSGASSSAFNGSGWTMWYQYQLHFNAYMQMGTQQVLVSSTLGGPINSLVVLAYGP